MFYKSLTHFLKTSSGASTEKRSPRAKPESRKATLQENLSKMRQFREDLECVKKGIGDGSICVDDLLPE